MIERMGHYLTAYIMNLNVIISKIVFAVTVSDGPARGKSHYVSPPGLPDLVSWYITQNTTCVSILYVE